MEEDHEDIIPISFITISPPPCAVCPCQQSLCLYSCLLPRPAYRPRLCGTLVERELEWASLAEAEISWLIARWRYSWLFTELPLSLYFLLCFVALHALRYWRSNEFVGNSKPSPKSDRDPPTTKEPIIHIRHATTSDMDAIVNQIGE